MQNTNHEVSPSHTLYDSNGSTSTLGGMQGKKKFAHFRRLFSGLHRRNHQQNDKPTPSSSASSSRHIPHGNLEAGHHTAKRSGQRLQPPTSSTVILRRPSSASSGSTASDENLPVISDRPEGFILETYGLPVRTIGSGTGGDVKLHQACDGRYYAIKTFMFQEAGDRTKMTSTGMNVRQWRHLLDEASFSLSLQHPSVIRTYQFVRESDGSVYSIMEYCGEDLFSVVQAGKLGEADTERLFFQLLSGIAYLHEQARIAHRDMKLDNMCVDEDGNLKIIDFGCSSAFDPLAPTQTRGVCGSDPYIAPEVFEPQSIYDPRKVDVWAAAVIYLAMISGLFPWNKAKASDPNYALYLKYHGRVIDHWLPKTNPANPVIKSMLAIDPLERPTIDVVMQTGWVASMEEKHGHGGTPLSKASTLNVEACEKHGYVSAPSTASSGISISSGY